MSSKRYSDSIILLWDEALAHEQEGSDYAATRERIRLLQS